MKYIVYLSTAIKLITDDELAEILKVARENNSKFNITGILLYSGGTFIQVLEGMPEVVDPLLEKIKGDPRHKNLVVLVDQTLTGRNFPDWTMGFATLNPEKGRKLIGYLESTDELLKNDETDIVFNMLKTFIDANNLVIKA